MKRGLRVAGPDEHVQLRAIWGGVHGRIGLGPGRRRQTRQVLAKMKRHPSGRSSK